MSGWLRTLGSRCRAWLSRERMDREFDEELTTHLDMLADDYERGGVPREEARRQAIRALGSPVVLRERQRDLRGLPIADLVAQDVRYGIRILWKTRGFTAVVLATLAIGIGANTALFSLVDDLLLRSLPVRDAERLVQVQKVAKMLGMQKVGTVFPQAEFAHLATHTHTISEMVGFRSLDRPAVAIDGVDEPARHVDDVTPNFFRDLGVQMALGSAGGSADAHTAVLSHRFWRSRFDGAATALGRALMIEGQSYTIVGVASQAFHGVSLESAPDVWISSPSVADYHLLARVKAGVAAAQARTELQLLYTQFANQHHVAPPGQRFPAIEIVFVDAGRGLSALRSQYQRPLLALTGSVALVLLTTCANVGSLLLVRNTARRRELTVRTALGAGRPRLILQSLVESLLLAVLGGALALVVAHWGVTVLLSMLPLARVPAALEFRADGHVLAFVAAVSTASAIFFGLVPAWRATQVDVTAVLRSGQGSGPGVGRRRLGRALVASQVAFSVLLLVGAGLFVRSVQNLVRTDIGFEPGGLVQVKLDTRGSGYREAQVVALYRLLVERIERLPGVRSVTGVRNDIMRNSYTAGQMAIPGYTFADNESWVSVTVMPAFFETMSIPIVRGRAFTAADFADGRPRIIVNESFARRYFPDVEAVGKQLGSPPHIEIVGVARDARLFSVRKDDGPMMYHMSPDDPDRIGALLVRVAGDPAASTAAIGAEVRRVHPRLVLDVRPMRDDIDRSIATDRMVAATSAFFSVLGLLLVAVGVFGVASYTVAQRTSELGIRMALGASRWSVIRASLDETLRVFAVGLAAGLIVSIAAVRLAGRFIADLLFGLTPTDVVSLAAAVALIGVVTVAACVLPARRATRIDPLVAIRHE